LLRDVGKFVHDVLHLDFAPSKYFLGVRHFHIDVPKFSLDVRQFGIDVRELSDVVCK
jgi:hypothetical protein